MNENSGYEGGCACSAVRYLMNRAPLFVNCCHCRWCQRETGAAFALNGILEATELTVLKGEVEMIDTPSNSGRGQRIARCPECHVALWSNYSSAKEAINFIRLGTLDNPDAFPPGAHIFTSTKQPWINLEGGAPAVPEYYNWKDYWSEESISRYKAALS